MNFKQLFPIDHHLHNNNTRKPLRYLKVKKSVIIQSSELLDLIFLTITNYSFISTPTSIYKQIMEIAMETNCAVHLTNLTLAALELQANSSITSHITRY